ncbi:MAG TPA: hypothetical protein IAB58_01580 [Candidatus Pelethosoma merdigallinarum]|nr:hypothetical protein [Candidatus Pelethosoma merdigallinarum]
MNSSILQDLKEQGIQSDKERMKLARGILLYQMKYQVSLEEAFALCLNKEKESKKEVSQKKKGIYYQGLPLLTYLETYYKEDLPTKEDQVACLRSIKHYLNKNPDLSIEQYFKDCYIFFLQKRKYHNLTFQGTSVTHIIKEYHPDYNKDQIYRCKRRLLDYLKAYPDKDPNVVIGYVLMREFGIPISMIRKR